MSNIDKREIHNQQLKAFITGFLSDPAHDNQSSRSLTAEVFRIALASLEAEPVCVIDQSNLDYLNSGSDADVWPASRKEMGDVLLYRAAPPASVSVPTFEEWCERTQQNPLGWVRDAMKEAYDGCRATMLQGADGTLTNEGTIPGGNSPVIPAGWVLVPVEPTAEMLQSGISAHYERSKIQIHDRPAPGPMDFAYVAMLAAAPQQEVK
ncbi:hypothetical protein [Enterobacter hormaechei]|uniref:hypothetical protein n=1 Tax=Enterobacter hormaechei TaxID=158836 RepID=UPI00356AB450|nr:hypothetical protein [Enterobacter hormaechei]